MNIFQHKRHNQTTIVSSFISSVIHFDKFFEVAIETVKFHIAQTKFFFEDTFVSHSGGPNEQFGTHEKLSWGVQGNLN